jgi:hypothetical protein
MTPERRTLILPVLLIVVGAGWILTTLGVGSGIDWVWTLGLAAIGLLSFAVGGWNKVTVVIGPFFIAATAVSLLRQTGRLGVEYEPPVLMIVAGVLLLIARSPAVPLPHWLTELPNGRKSAKQAATGGDPNDRQLPRDAGKNE